MMDNANSPDAYADGMAAAAYEDGRDTRSQEWQAWQAAILEAALDCVIVSDVEGRILEFNPAAERTFGWTRDQALGRRIADLLVPPALRAAHMEGMRRVRDGGRPRLLGQRLEVPALRADGAIIPVELTLVQVDTAGPPRFVGYLRDISERKRAEERLQQATADAQAASRSKSEFLAVVSHEMRTPLNSVLGTMELVQDTKLDPEQREYLQTCHTSARQLLTLINEILDFSQIEAGELELRTAPFRVPEVLQPLVQRYRDEAAKKGLDLRCHIADSVPPVLVGDSERLRQVLDNLLSNAVKFTDRGYIAVDVGAEPLDEQHARLQFAIADTGIGIAPEDRRRVFESFVQVDSSATRRFGGVGLGLSICAQLVEMLGGKIGVEDGPEGGSRFHFTARFRRGREEPAVAASTAASASPATRHADQPLHVLLAEDDDASRRVVSRMLEKSGLRVSLACDGREALAILDQAADPSIDLVLMDVMMPELSGIEATQEIRRREVGTGRHLPVVALTAAAMKGDAEKCLAAGMDAYMAKPVQGDALLTLIQETCRPTGTAAGAATVGTVSEPAERLAPARAPEPLDPRVLDVPALQDRYARDPDLLREVLHMFLAGADQSLTEMQQTVERKDLPRLAQLAHRLKGSISNFCAERSHTAAEALQETAADGFHTDAERQLARLRYELTRLRAALEPLL